MLLPSSSPRLSKSWFVTSPRLAVNRNFVNLVPTEVKNKCRKKNNSTLPLLSFLFVERDYKTQLFQYPNEATIGFHVVKMSSCCMMQTENHSFSTDSPEKKVKDEKVEVEHVLEQCELLLGA